MNEDRILARNATAYFCELDDEIVLFHPVHQEYFKLDRVGAAVWRQLEKPSAFGEVVSRLLTTYDVSDDVCREQVTVFVNELVDLQLVQAT